MKRQLLICTFYLMSLLRLVICLKPRSCTSYRLVFVVILTCLTILASFLHIFSISATLYCLNYKTKNAVEDLDILPQKDSKRYGIASYVKHESAAAFTDYISCIENIFRGKIDFLLDGGFDENTKTKAFFELHCHHYKRGQVAGNLCDDLCGDGQHLIITSCFMPHLAKDIVFSARWRRRTVIIKASHENLAAFDPFPFPSVDDHLISPNEFLNVVRDVVAVTFGINFNEQRLLHPRKFIRTLLPGYSHGFPKNASKVLLQSMWLLAQQKEFLTYKLFESSGLFPIVYGSCGQFYAVEQLEPLSSYIHTNWELRTEIVSGILNLLEKAEYHFPFALRICDMKLNHFGVDSSNNFKILDGDDLYFQDVLNKIVSYGTCDSHHDCSFFDCKTQCDLSSHTCNTGLINTNLQAACKKIFMHGHAFSPGLLHSPPQNVSVLLDKVVETCIASTSADLLFFKLKNEFVNLLNP